MKVPIKKEKEETTKEEKEDVKNDLPGDDVDEKDESLEDVTEGVEEDDEESSKLSERERKLELEKAKLEGQIEVLSGKKNPTQTQSQKQQQLQQIYADLDLEDDDFKQKYGGYGKARVLQAVNQEVQAETTVKITRLEAKNSLSRKYADFSEFEDQIDEALADASPSVLQDPDRLKKYMERVYLASAKDVKKKGELPDEKMKSKKEAPVKKIVKDFHAPTPRGDDKSEEERENQDEIKEENRALAAKFGLRSEKQRQKFMSEFIPMDLGGGVKFEDPKKGFEKVAAK